MKVDLKLLNLEIIQAALNLDIASDPEPTAEKMETLNIINEAIQKHN